MRLAPLAVSLLLLGFAVVPQASASHAVYGVLYQKSAGPICGTADCLVDQALDEVSSTAGTRVAFSFVHVDDLVGFGGNLEIRFGDGKRVCFPVPIDAYTPAGGYDGNLCGASLHFIVTHPAPNTVEVSFSHTYATEGVYPMDWLMCCTLLDTVMSGKGVAVIR